ncbi:sugar ABC transporter permease [Aerococcus sp. UMB7834]|uniref:carbohydrate ABC transporter permease n=1 Tax=Aerococcus sp. UMB7834 TaxID=3046342 RepID=UPI00254C0EE9|nr:sugar ABC transporter permease [Aerococcus sp. UMB7834]MDK6805838.1 sugar ABC transporter permease [Aerococcus sp. UMB7834]
MKQARMTPYLLILPCALLLVLLYGYPIALTVWQSFNEVNVFTNVSEFVGLGNFKEVMTDSNFSDTMAITFKYTVVTVLLKMVFGFGVGYLLHSEIYFKKIFTFLVLIPWAIPQVAAGTIWQWLLDNQYGYINYYLMEWNILSEPIPFLSRPTTAFYSASIVDTWMGIPMLAMIFLAALEAVPKNLYEAAAMDGAGKVRQFFDVTLPGIRGVLLTTLVLVTIWTFNSFNVIYVLTQGGPMRSTETLIIRIYQEAFSRFDLGASSALTVIAVIILTILTALYVMGGRSRD